MSDLYSKPDAQAVIDRWETTGGPTTTEVALARTVVALWSWSDWVGHRHEEMDAEWDEWLRFQHGIHPSYAPPRNGSSAERES